jgi:D-glycero-alpha-D-manno-heptose-7-phosphate kinase
MIIVRSPLRITLAGGGTDLPSYYRNHDGFLIAAAIDKYVFVSVSRPLTPQVSLKHSVIELVETIDEVRHPIIRAALRLLEVGRPQIEITTFSDVPSGTGLGSSGSFTTALLRALHANYGTDIHPRELAEEACHIELNVLGEPVGKQDQYIAAYGGVTCLTFLKDDTVTAEPLAIDDEIRSALEENILLFFTGHSRAASDILKNQDARLKRHDKALTDSFHYEKDNAFRSKEALEKGDLRAYGRLVHEHWVRKRTRSLAISSPKFDRWYDLGLKNGASGGKLMGAGAGGFLMFCADDKTKLRNAMREEGLIEMPFRFERFGTRLVAKMSGN